MGVERAGPKGPGTTPTHTPAPPTAGAPPLHSPPPPISLSPTHGHAASSHMSASRTGPPQAHVALARRDERRPLTRNVLGRPTMAADKRGQ